MMQLINEALRTNMSRQAYLQEEIDLIDKGRPANKPIIPQNPVIARNPITVFYAPYFKDANLYTHPPNMDTLNKRAQKELDLYLTNPREFTETEKRNLIDAVREDAIAKRLADLVEEEKTVLLQLRKAGISQLEKIELRSQLRKLIANETEIKTLSDDVLFCNPKEDYDWLKIAAQTFNRSVSPATCKLMWQNNLHPSINRGAWTKEEDLRLTALTREPDRDGLLRPRKDWEFIAKQLGTNRTAFLCFHRYQMKHNQIFNKRKWTPEEDFRLKQLVRQTRINRFVPWTKVSYYMHNRTKDQCYQRYVYSLRDEVRQGFFEEAEDFIILVGVKLFGTLWARISHFIPSRTPMQIHSRYNTFLKANFDNWTSEEDFQLLKAVKESQMSDWKSVAQAFGSKRTRSQCRQRFHYIHRSYKQASNFSLQQIPYGNKESRQKKRQQELYAKLEEKVGEFLQTHKVQSNCEEEENENVHLDFKREGFHVTPDGDKVPMKALIKFMKSLDLPKADKAIRPLAQDVGLLRSRFRVFDKKGNVTNDECMRTSPMHLNLNKKISKIFEPCWPIRQIRMKEVYRSDKDLKTARQAGRTLIDILSANHLLKGPENGMDLMSALRKQNECKKDVLSERQKQFLEILRARSESEENLEQGFVPLLSPPALMTTSPAIKPLVKTYTRKTAKRPIFKKAAPTPTPQPFTLPRSPPMDYLKFVPPNLNTLVAMRGLLLLRKNLRSKGNLEDLSNVEETDSDFSPTFSGLRRSTDSIAHGGRLSVRNADKLLRDRLISLFFWPSLMAKVKPNERKDVFDIIEGDDTVAACNPLDVQEIIEHAQAKTANTPRVVVGIRKRKQDKPQQISSSPAAAAAAAESSESESSGAPPPYKKRLLVASTSSIFND